MLLQRIFVLLFDDSSLFSFASWSLGLHRAAFPLVIGRRSAGRPHFLISPISRDYLKIVKIESWNMNRCRCYRLKEDQAICLFVGRDGKEGGELLLPLVVVALTLLGWKRSGKFITCQIHASDTVSGMLYFLLGKCQQNSSLLFTIAVVRWRCCRRRKHN